MTQQCINRGSLFRVSLSGAKTFRLHLPILWRGQPPRQPVVATFFSKKEGSQAHCIHPDNKRSPVAGTTVAAPQSAPACKVSVTTTMTTADYWLLTGARPEQESNTKQKSHIKYETQPATIAIHVCHCNNHFRQTTQ